MHQILLASDICLMFYAFALESRTYAVIVFIKSIRLNLLLLGERFDQNRMLTWIVGYNSLVSQFSRFPIGLLGYRGGTRAKVPTVHHTIRLSFTSCCRVPVTWTPRLDLWGPNQRIIYETISAFVILRRIFGPKRDENGEWRRFHNEELPSLYRSPNIVRVIKSRRLRWAGHVARMEEGRSAF